MSSQAFPRFIGQVLSLVLCAVLLAGPGARAAPVRLAALSGPVADFTATPTSGLAPLKVVFTNTSAGTYTSCLWEFGDGKSTTKDNPEPLRGLRWWRVLALRPQQRPPPLLELFPADLAPGVALFEDAQSLLPAGLRARRPLALLLAVHLPAQRPTQGQHDE